VGFFTENTTIHVKLSPKTSSELPSGNKTLPCDLAVVELLTPRYAPHRTMQQSFKDYCLENMPDISNLVPTGSCFTISKLCVQHRQKSTCDFDIHTFAMTVSALQYFCIV